MILLENMALLETRKLKKIGVEVYFTEDNIWTFNDEDGELKLTIMATLAQNESKKTSQRVKAGQKISFLNGVFYGTGNILWYDRVGSDMIINEEQAKTVRIIYDMFLKGKGSTDIKAYLDNMLTNEEYSSKRKELEDTIITLENRLKELEENSKNQSISVKDKINILKQKVDMLLDIDTNEISDVLIDSIVDKITVHNDRYEWKINYISSSSEENDENNNGVFFARMIITVDEIKRYNDKKKILKKVFQKDPIVMDIYI